MPLDDPAAIAAVLGQHRPWAVINAAGWVRVDEAEDHEAGCYGANAGGPALLAQAIERYAERAREAGIARPPGEVGADRVWVA